MPALPLARSINFTTLRFAKDSSMLEVDLRISSRDVNRKRNFLNHTINGRLVSSKEVNLGIEQLREPTVERERSYTPLPGSLQP